MTLNRLTSSPPHQRLPALGTRPIFTTFPGNATPDFVSDVITASIFFLSFSTSAS